MVKYGTKNKDRNERKLQNTLCLYGGQAVNVRRKLTMITMTYILGIGIAYMEAICLFVIFCVLIIMAAVLYSKEKSIADIFHVSQKHSFGRSAKFVSKKSYSVTSYKSSRQSTARIVAAKIAITFIISLSAGAVNFINATVNFENGMQYQSETRQEMRLRIETVESAYDGKSKARVRILSVGGRYIKNRQIALATFLEPVNEIVKLSGRVVIVHAKLSEPKERSNPRCFDYKTYLRSEGISHTIWVDEFTVTDEEPSFKGRIVNIILTQREAFLSKLPKGEIREVIRGVIFGDSSEIDENTYASFRDNGTAHVLAVSGLHVGILFSVYRRLHKKIRSKVLSALFILFLLIYGSLTLWTVSVTRAVLLIFILMLGRSVDRRYDMMTALAATALAVSMYQPWVIFGASFQMSFLSVLGIATIYPYIKEKLPEWIAISISVQFVIAPFMAYVFNRIPVAGILVGVPIVAIISIIVPVGLISLISSFLFGSILFTDEILVSVTNMMIKLNDMLAMDGKTASDIASPPIWLMVIIYGGVLFTTSDIFFISARRGKTEVLLIGLLVITGMSILVGINDRTEMDECKLVFIDVGQGDCLQVRTHGRNILIDGGGKKDFNIGDKVLKPYMLKNMQGEVDLALTTHKHEDHFKGIEELAEVYPVNKVMTKGHAGDVYRISDECKIEILWPLVGNTETEDENMNSRIYKIFINNITVLVTGDIGFEGEDAMVNYYRKTKALNCDILKVAHHGSRYSTGDEFLEAVNPKAAVISVGADNMYGHPSDETLERLNKYRIPVFRTDEDGAVGLRAEKGSISVVTLKQRSGDKSN